MKKRIYSLFILFFSVTLLQAQEIDYNLSDYKIPDVQLQTLDLSFYSYGGYTSDEGRKNSSSNNNLTAYYSLYRNSAKLQQKFGGGVLFGYDYDKSEQDDSERKSNDLGFNLNLYNQTRYYFKPKIFFGIGMSLLHVHDKYVSKIDGDMDMDRRSSMINMFLPIQFGYGRVEIVNDAQRAIYVLDALQKEGKLAKDISADDVTKFAEKIAQIDNTRFFDSRLQLMKELESLDSYLTENGFVSESDIRYFTTLMDLWRYGNQQARQSGFRVAAVFEPHYINSKNTDELVDESSTTRVSSYSVGVEAVYNKPISQQWQHQIGVEAYYDDISKKYKRYGLSDFEDPFEYQRLNLSHSQSIEYIPDTRTSVSLSYDIGYINLLDDNLDEFVDNELISKRFYFGIDLDAYYYISPKFRLTGYLELSNNNYTYKTYDYLSILDESDYDKLDLNYSVSLSYSLF